MARVPCFLRRSIISAAGIASLLVWDGRPARSASVHMERAVRSVPAGNNAVEVFAANLDGDSHVDLVALNRNSSNLSPFAGNGDGTFRVLAPVPTASLPTTAGRGDLNEDGYDDWVVCGGTPTLVVQRGGPSGVGPPTSVPDPTGAVSCLLTRIDDDSHLDLVIVRSANALSVRLGNGDGTFQAPVEYPAGVNARGVATGDLNGDGHADVVVGHSAGSTVSVFYGHANGSLDAPVSVAMVTSPSSVAVADLNGDGRLDLISPGATRLGNPAGGFFPAVSWGIAVNAIADMNLDGRPDAVGNGGAVSLGDGYGGLLPAITTPIGTLGASCVADFDEDGTPDVAAIAGSSFAESPIAILLGVGDGTFPTPRIVDPGGGRVVGIQIADTDHDGHGDLVLETGDGELFSLLGDGKGSFPVRRTGIGFTSGWIRLGDFDEDGTLDLVDSDAGGFAIRHGVGNGTFTTSPYFASGSNGGGVDVGDLQPDGHLDVAWRNSFGAMVHLGSGDGTVGTGVAVTSYTLPHQTKGVRLADVNGDGREDLVFWHTDLDPTVRLTGVGPTYAPAVRFPSLLITLDLDTGDLDRDGKADVVTVYPGDDAGGIWKSSGNGAYGLLDTYGAGDSPTVRTGQFTEDDSLDFAVLDAHVGTVAIRAGRGDGTFADREDFDLGVLANVMESGDVDSDGVQDLAVALSDDRVGLLLSRGAPRLPIVSQLGAQVLASSIRIEWIPAEPTRWAQFAVERAIAGSSPWERLALPLTTNGDTVSVEDDGAPPGAVWYRVAARTSDGQWFFSGPTPARDVAVPALVSLASAHVEAGRVRLRWIDAAGSLTEVVVERSEDGSSWRSIGSIRADGTGVLEFTDEQVRTGARYGYRLEYEEDGVRTTAGETWLEIPSSARLRLSAESPQDVRGGLDLSWELPGPGEAVIRLFDLAGREIATQRVHADDSSLRRQRFTTPAALAPGVYLATIESGAEKTSMRVIVLR